MESTMRTENGPPEDDNEVAAHAADGIQALSIPSIDSQYLKQDGYDTTSGALLASDENPSIQDDSLPQRRHGAGDKFSISAQLDPDTHSHLLDTCNENLVHTAGATIAVSSVLDSSLLSPVNKQLEPPDDDDADGPPPGWQIKIETERVNPSMEIGTATEGRDGSEDDGPPPGWQSLTPSPTSSVSPLPLTPMFSSEPPLNQPSDLLPHPPLEMAQMVCGSCRKLLSYRKGYRQVQCASCKVTNYVLEAHELGIVKCDYCATLLMYPYSASSIRCASCRSVTEIGEHNKRPPWSVQQGNPPQLSNLAR